MPMLIEDYIERIVTALPQAPTQSDLDALAQASSLTFALLNHNTIVYSTDTRVKDDWHAERMTKLLDSNDWQPFQRHNQWHWHLERGHVLVKVTQPHYTLLIQYPFRSDVDQDKGHWLMFWVLGIILVTFLWIVYLLRPIKHIQQGITHYSEGDFSHRLSVKGKTDLSNLAMTLNEMAEQIDLRLQRERELFNAMSHELRTPLARLRVAVELAEQGGLRETMLRAVQRMEHLIETLILRERSGVIADLTQVTQLEGLVKTWLEEDFETQAQSIHFTSESISQVSVELFSLRLILKNLVENALKYGNDQQVEVTLVSQHSQLILRVKDSGQGMDPETLKQVFDPFFRSDKVRTIESSGLGLGLYLVKSFVKNLDGEIEVVSEVMSGTLVEVRLPC